MTKDEKKLAIIGLTVILGVIQLVLWLVILFGDTQQ